MYDIDAGRSPSLRLDAPSRADLQARRAEIRRQIDALWVEYCDLVLESDTQAAQSRPIPASPNTLTMSNDFWDRRHSTMTGPDPLVARSNGYVEPISRR